MLLDESPLIVHCSFKEWMGLFFTLILSQTVALVLLLPPFSSLFSLNSSQIFLSLIDEAFRAHESWRKTKEQLT
ncbi:hypothetical protein QUA56_36045, partial [Microcoleus sp. N3A4]|uniref:hypothetical protein n=1 Tax=Microcoleus sp. N3A4 TaxID=3055379 RepID=UPI002FD2A6B1